MRAANNTATPAYGMSMSRSSRWCGRKEVMMRSGKVIDDVLRGEPGHVVPAFNRRRADMRHDNDVVERAQRMVRRQRLGLRDVQSRATDRTLRQRLDQILRRHHRAASQA